MTRRRRLRNPGEKFYLSELWKNLSKYVRFERARGQCEVCGARHGVIAPDWRSVVILQCAHLNGRREDVRLSNLRALCPRCHGAHDRAAKRRWWKRRERAVARLVEMALGTGMKGEG